ncbi:hypothetical protein RJ639_033449 [Escallonia herrerae]|uniref:Sulfhydryl oxidase n=1 Tax=Escallonia herrerae TaxID=1293975 RepID=A0AA89BGI6_9ASTE|nr:hypothetical protein RJ639_033449 [Escallonia herrerae]
MNIGCFLYLLHLPCTTQTAVAPPLTSPPGFSTWDSCEVNNCGFGLQVDQICSTFFVEYQDLVVWVLLRFDACLFYFLISIGIKCLLVASLLVFLQETSATPVTKEELGRATWTLLHTLAAQYPDKPTRQQKKDVKELMGILSRIYPCKECADHFKEVLSIEEVLNDAVGVEDRGLEAVEIDIVGLLELVFVVGGDGGGAEPKLPLLMAVEGATLGDLVRSSSFPTICLRTLSTYAGPAQTPAELAQASVKVSLSRANKASSYLSTLRTSSKRKAGALSDCLSQIFNTVDELGRTLSELKHLRRSYKQKSFQALALKPSNTDQNETQANPVQAGSQGDFSQWLCHVHNIVNRSLGKLVFPCERVDARWGKLECEQRACDLQGITTNFGKEIR